MKAIAAVGYVLVRFMLLGKIEIPFSLHNSSILQFNLLVQGEIAHHFFATHNIHKNINIFFLLVTKYV